MKLKLSGEEVCRFRKDEVIPADPDNASLQFELCKRLVEEIEVLAFQA